MFKHSITYLLVLLLGLPLFSQKNEIICYAPDFKNQVATLVTYADYISYNYKTLDRGVIGDDGLITFNYDPKKGMKAFIQIQDKSATIYLDPNTEKYYVSFPKDIENVQKLTGNTVRLVFDQLPNDDLNTLILEFNLRLDYFLYGDTAKVERLMLQNAAFRDSLADFTKKVYNIYKDVDNKYFQTYLKYSIASVALFSDRQEPAKNKYIVFETFIKTSPILYHHDAYMEFVKDFYKDALSDIALIDRDKATFAINNANSRSKLDEVMAGHYYLKNDVFREMIMINALQEAYNTTYFNRENIKSILSTIIKDPVADENRDLARGVLNFQEKLAPGSEAPMFEWVEPNGDTVTLRSLRGRHVYLQFWASWNKPSLQEMLIIKQLKEKYGKYVTFVSISLDHSRDAYQKFIDQSIGGMDWHFGYYNGDSKLLDDYNLRNVPIYFYLDDRGRIEQAPAYGPSPNGIYKSIDETFFYLKKKLEPKEEFKVGRY